MIPNNLLYTPFYDCLLQPRKTVPQAPACTAQVRIIHGMGTGKLRKGVHDYLKHNPQVESYTMGGQGEGGLGATVVKLKQKGK